MTLKPNILDLKGVTKANSLHPKDIDIVDID